MQFESLEEIIEFAIGKEKEAAEFYRSVAQQESFAGVKETFEGFASEEEKHWQMLEDLEGHRDQIAAYKLKWIPDMKRSDYLTDLTYEPGMDYPDILLLAMKREEKALRLYNELADKAKDAEQFKMFQILCQEEAKHKQILETMYDDHMAELGD